MKLFIDDAIRASYPTLRIAIIVGRGLVNADQTPEFARSKAEAESQFMARYGPEDVNNHPNILAWRETYQSFGTRPREHRPTAEALLRRVVRGNPVSMINLVVTSYLLAELEYFLPVGGYDLTKIDGDIVLRFSRGEEKFIPLGGGDEEFTYQDEVIYADQSKVLTRRWNYRDCDAAKITSQSSEIALFCEAAHSSIKTEDVEGCADLIARTIRQFCGGDVNWFLVKSADPRTNL